MMSSLFKKLGMAVAVMVMASSVHAQTPFYLSDFESSSSGGSGGFGMARINNGSYLKGSLTPKLSVGPINGEFDLNMYLPSDGSSQSFFTVVFHNVGLDINRQYGFKWGRLTHITLGQGLLMGNYDSGSSGPSEFTPDKAAFLGYVTLANLRLDALMTARGLYGVRTAYAVNNVVFGTPLVVGGTYVKDPNTTGLNAPSSGYGADVALPFMGDIFTAYSEYTRLDTEADGIATGVRGSLLSLDYRLEYRDLSASFIPSYFNSTYELGGARSLAKSSRFSGFLGSASASLFDYFKAGVRYEKYDTTDLVTVSGGWKRFQDTVGVINYTRPFNAPGVYALLDMDVLYINQSLFDYVINLKRQYQTETVYTDTYGFGLRMDLTRLNVGKLLGLPF